MLTIAESTPSPYRFSPRINGIRREGKSYIPRLRSRHGKCRDGPPYDLNRQTGVVFPRRASHKGSAGMAKKKGTSKAAKVKPKCEMCGAVLALGAFPANNPRWCEGCVLTGLEWGMERYMETCK